MGVYIPDILRVEAGALQRTLHRLAWSDPRGMWLRKVVVVRRNAIAADFCQNFRPPRLCLREIFKSQKGGAFSEHEPAAGTVERPAFLRCRCLQGIEPDKDQFGNCVVAARKNTVIAAGT